METALLERGTDELEAGDGSAGASPSQAGASPSQAGASPSQVAGARLLVVDDMEENREVLRRFLARSGYVVETASDGRVALSMIERARFDAVLLDVMMPEVGGYEVLRTIRRRWSVAE